MINRFSIEGQRFEAAVEAVIDGDAETLRALLEQDPGLATARSPREHGATLLHYVAANGVEDERQRTPANAIEIARLLVGAGAHPSATAAFYGGGPGSTALVALVSSGHPYDAGLQEELVEVFCSAPGTRPDGLEGIGYPMATAFAFFYPGAAEALARSGASVDNMVHAAGLGRLDLVEGWLKEDGSLSESHPPYRGCYDFLLEDPDDILELGLVYAAMSGRLEVVRLLDRMGVDLSGGPHSNETALHLAAFKGHLDVVRYLVENGADTAIEDDRWGGTPFGWAVEGYRADVRDYLVEHSAIDLYEAAAIGRTDLVAEMLGDDDPNEALRGGDPGLLLRIAAWDGHLALVEWLLERGADPSLLNGDGESALDHAIRRGHEEVVALLCAREG